MSEKWRNRAAKGLRKYFERRRWPRLSLGLVMILTGLAGFGISGTLLHFGMREMWQRYPLAVVGGYVVFLGLLRLWVEVERAHFDPRDPAVLDALSEGAEEPEPAARRLDEEKGSWFDSLDLPSFDGADSLEGCALGIVAIAVIGLIAIAVTMIAGAPVLVAEVAVDAFLVSILYRRLKAAEREHWLGAAVRRTWVHALLAALLLALLGFCIPILVPGADSIGEAIRLWRDGR